MNFCLLHRVFIDPSEGFLYNGQDPLLNIMSAGHGLNVYVNDQLQGERIGLHACMRVYIYSLVMTHL